jgi:hypothetical protein
MANSVIKYQLRIVQSIDRCVSRAVHARIELNRERRLWDRKNSAPKGYNSG